MPTKDEVAEMLAQYQYEVGDDVQSIHRLLSDAEDDPREPVKLLLVREETVPVGIMPLAFGKIPENGWLYPFSLVVITPEEYQQVLQGSLSLPVGWSIGQPIKDHVSPTQVAA